MARTPPLLNSTRILHQNFLFDASPEMLSPQNDGVENGRGAHVFVILTGSYQRFVILSGGYPFACEWTAEVERPLPYQELVDF